jgi:pre-rRNA-processing protein TSR3
MKKPTVILRHRRENLKKCSLRGLETRSDMIFLTYPKDSLPDLSGYIQLELNAPPLTKDDSCHGLFLIDGTWDLAKVMSKSVTQPLIKRSLPPNLKTAYPRRQTRCDDPEKGLASIEALYAAYFILGKDTKGLLDTYYWKEEFLSINKDVFENLYCS